MEKISSRWKFVPEPDVITIGVDEVGRGPLAGPVVACACILPNNWYEVSELDKLNDSKKLSAKARELISNKLKTECLYEIYSINSDEIDDINILQASLKAMKLAVDNLHYKLNSINSTKIFIDGNIVPNGLAANAIIKGDSLHPSIAAASVIAKVFRDEYMARLALEFPFYGWEKNAGYGTAKHIEAIKTYGVTKHHRKSFEPIKSGLSG